MRVIELTRFLFFYYVFLFIVGVGCCFGGRVVRTLGLCLWREVWLLVACECFWAGFM